MSRFIAVLMTSLALTVAPLQESAEACRDATAGNWGALPRTLNVYIQTGSAAAIGLSDTDFGSAVSRATSIWNEEAGSALKLQWAGPTSLQHIDGAVVIFGGANPSLVNGVGGCVAGQGQFPDYCCGNAFATAAHSGSTTWAAVWIRSHIASSPTTCSQIQWRSDGERQELTPPQTDLISILVHELGHAAFGLTHTDECSLIFDPESVMKKYYDSYDFGRVLRLYDKVEAQAKQGFRSSYSSVRSSFYDPGTGTWGPFRVILGAHAWYRFGSLPQASHYNIPIAFVENTILSTYGSIREETWNYPGGVTNSQVLSDPFSGLPEPVAVAAKPPGTEVIVVYKKAIGTVLFVDPATRVCYRKSTNSGVAWGPETCPLNIGGSVRPGISAGYDPATNVFIITFAMDSGQLRLMTIPATGSATPSAITTLSQYSWHAPSIACSSAVTTNGCRLVWEKRDSAGCLRWYEGGVSPTTGQFNPLIGREQCYSMFDTPSVAYTANGNSFYLAFGQAASAAYALKMTGSGTSWTGVADLWNSTGSYISHPVMSSYSVCGWGCTQAPIGSFINYNQ